ncbi:MAG TPA: hypothetical protein VIN07_07585, partial [Flavipsychrobacter sp.]
FMKKLLFPLSMLLTCTIAQAQPILLPNGDFENWTNINYDNPDKWDHSNFYTLSSYGFANVSKVTGTSANYAIRLETMVSGTDTAAAFFSNSDDPISGDGGMPYTFQATQFHGDYRYNISSGDTAWIILKFKYSGNIISDTMYPITGSQATFTSFNLPIPAMSQAPDTIILAAISGNAINSTPKAGSWLELDALSFSDNIMNIALQDGDFEDWTAQSTDNPNGWVNNGLGEVTQTTDNYSGSYAAKLVSKDDGTGYIDEGSIMLGMPNQIPGMPFTKTVDTLTGYYKYVTTGSDYGILNVAFFDANFMPVGSGILQKLYPASSYAYFEVPI